jgi:hypothetical protein
MHSITVHLLLGYGQCIPQEVAYASIFLKHIYNNTAIKLIANMNLFPLLMHDRWLLFFFGFEHILLTSDTAEKETPFFFRSKAIPTIFEIGSIPLLQLMGGALKVRCSPSAFPARI